MLPSKIKALTHENKEYACEQIAKGVSPDIVAKSLDMSVRTFHRALSEDPIFAKEMATARDLYMHNLVSGLIGITDGCTTMAEVQAARLESDNIKWTAGKFVPQVFGDNINVNLNHHLDLSSVLLAAESRVLPLLQRKTDAQDAHSEAILPQYMVMSECESGRSTDINATEEIPDELKELI